MKITSIEQQKKDRNRVNLYVDGEFYAGLDLSTVARLGFYEGKELAQEELGRVDNEEEYQKCLNRGLLLVTQRMQSERELWQKLGKSFEKPVVGKCLSRLRELGYVDDQKFAELWTRERSRNLGARKLEIELKGKGIAPEIYQPILESLNPQTARENALRLAQKKYKPELGYDKNFTRISGLLNRKGYDYSMIKEIIQDLDIKKDR